MEILYYFLIIIIAIITIIALRKLSKSKKTNIKYESFSKIKNNSFENNFNNYANNENIITKMKKNYLVIKIR